MSRAGSFGCFVHGPVGLQTPAEDIKAILYDPAAVLTPFGLGARILPFLRDQLAMQARKMSR